MRAGTLCGKAHSISSQLEAAQQDEHLPGSVVGSTAVMLRNAPAGIASSRGSAPAVGDSMPSRSLIRTACKEVVTILAQCDLGSSLQIKQHLSCMPIKAQSAFMRGEDRYFKEGERHPQIVYCTSCVLIGNFAAQSLGHRCCPSQSSQRSLQPQHGLVGLQSRLGRGETKAIFRTPTLSLLCSYKALPARVQSSEAQQRLSVAPSPLLPLRTGRVQKVSITRAHVRLGRVDWTEPCIARC